MSFVNSDRSYKAYYDPVDLPSMHNMKSLTYSLKVMGECVLSAAQQLDAVREIKDCVLLNDQGLDALSKALDDALAAAAGRVDSPASA